MNLLNSFAQFPQHDIITWSFVPKQPANEETIYCPLPRYSPGAPHALPLKRFVLMHNCCRYGIVSLTTDEQLTHDPAVSTSEDTSCL